jgi:hypothetical protein
MLLLVLVQLHHYFSLSFCFSPKHYLATFSARCAVILSNSYSNVICQANLFTNVQSFSVPSRTPIKKITVEVAMGYWGKVLMDER